MQSEATPPGVVKRLHVNTAQTLNKPDVRERPTTLGLTIVGSTPERFSGHIRSEFSKWSAVINDAGVKTDWRQGGTGGMPAAGPGTCVAGPAGGPATEETVTACPPASRLQTAGADPMLPDGDDAPRSGEMGPDDLRKRYRSPQATIAHQEPLYGFRKGGGDGSRHRFHGRSRLQ
ncbi:MAG: hypothetical protein AB1558_10340 [Thermodesulfobacteriota bacterium]